MPGLAACDTWIVSVDPFVVDGGLKLAVAPLGRPVTDSATVPVKPPAGVIVTAKEVPCPSATDRLAGDAERAKSLIAKLPLLVPVPPGVVTAIGPLVDPDATTAVICVSLFTVKLAAGVPLNLTAVAPVRLLPVIVTVVPIGPFAGANEDSVGPGTCA